ncbi:AP-3 complex subunit beta [Tilletia horrida]|nr:AP-3 complex subunit beta [Tilletia horrida]
MANARSLAYLHQRMLERAEDAAAALRAAIGPTTTDLATLQQQQQQQQQLQLHFSSSSNSSSGGGGGGGGGAGFGHAAGGAAGEDDDDDDDSNSVEDGDELGTGSRRSTATAINNQYLAGILASLDSSSDDARIDGLRRIIAAIAAGRYRIAHAALPAVLKLTSSSITSLHVRKLVSIILARSASAQPDLALLAVNSFQRDLSHHSPLIRASALRALGSLRIPVLAPILRLAIASAARDSHPHVRRVAALSLSKAYALDPSALPELVSLLLILFNDRSPSVLGAALVAFSVLGYPPPQTAAVPAGPVGSTPVSTSVYDYDDGSENANPAPQEQDISANDTAESATGRKQFALLHPFYRKLCYALADMDEWSQAHALDVMLLYARANFSEPVAKVQPAPRGSAAPAHVPKDKEREKQDIEAFFADDDTEPTAAAVAGASTHIIEPATAPAMDEKAAARRNADLDLLLNKAQALLMSRNPAVVLSVVRLTLYLSPQPQPGAPTPTYPHSLIRPLLRYVRPSSSSSAPPSFPELAYLAIVNLAHLVTAFPVLLPNLQPHLPAFLPRSASADEPLYLSLAKIDILVALCARNVVGAGWVLAELEWLSRTADAAVGGPSYVDGEEDGSGTAEEGGRLARRAVEAIGEVVARVREQLTDDGAGSSEERERDRAEVDELTERALDILLRLIRGSHSTSSTSTRAGKTNGKSLTGKKALAAQSHNEALQPGVVARAITVLRALLQWRSPPSSGDGAAVSATAAAPATPSAHELSTGRILAHFPVFLFGPPTAAASAMPTTTTSVNAEGKTVQIIRRPKILGRNAIRDAEARANLFWLLGQHCRTRVAVVLSPRNPGASKTYLTLAELVGPDLLRRAALNFANESARTKLQILTYAAKLGAFLPSTAAGPGRGDAEAKAAVMGKVDALVGYVMQLGRYDADYDVRDRARFCKALSRGLVLPPKASSTKVAPGTNGEAAAEALTGAATEGGQDADAAEEQQREDEEGEEEEDEEVGGVTLRREQVLMILFEGKQLNLAPLASPNGAENNNNNNNNSFGTLALALAASVSSRVGSDSHTTTANRKSTRFLLRGWARTAVPPWASAAEATPPSVRDPPLVPSATTTPATATTTKGVGVGAGGASLAPVAHAMPAVEAQAERAVEALASRAAKRLSGSGPGTGTASGGAALGGQAAAPLVHSSANNMAQARYKDLEDFLDDDEDEMEEVEVELDEPALEDEEYGVEDEYEDEEEEEEEEEAVFAGTATRAQLPESSESNAWAS